ncbi:MAG: hypothetical protein ACXWJK_00495 [Burkholderiaceae bacterium]
MTQQEFLRDAKEQLGMTWKEFAQRIGAPETTLKKWMAAPEAEDNYREMPSTVWTLVREIMEHEALKRKFERLHNKYSKSC